MDFRLSVFVSVARNLSFTKAAKELLISQPAISKNIRELESTYRQQLFERGNNRISLTPAGQIFLSHAEQILEAYRNMQLEMNLLGGSLSGSLRLGASTTIAQYFLPPILARFVARFPDIKLTMLTGNSEQIEMALREHRIDIGMIESNSRATDLHYQVFAKDELVMVTHVRNKVKDELSLDELLRRPLVLREVGSGTLQVFEDALHKHGFKRSQLNVLLYLGSTEGIKLFLLNSPDTYAIVSISTVINELNNNQLKVIEIEGLRLDRSFSFVSLQGQHNQLHEVFMQLVQLSHKQQL